MAINLGNVAGVVKSANPPLERDGVTEKRYVLWAKITQASPEQTALHYYSVTASKWVEIENLLEKEPLIGAKNSAFNKNFGSGEFDVAKGNHNHDSTYKKLPPIKSFSWNPQDDITEYNHYHTRTSASSGNFTSKEDNYLIEICNLPYKADYYEFTVKTVIANKYNNFTKFSVALDNETDFTNAPTIRTIFNSASRALVNYSVSVLYSNSSAATLKYLKIYLQPKPFPFGLDGSNKRTAATITVENSYAYNTPAILNIKKVFYYTERNTDSKYYYLIEDNYFTSPSPQIGTLPEGTHTFISNDNYSIITHKLT